MDVTADIFNHKLQQHHHILVRFFFLLPYSILGHIYYDYVIKKLHIEKDLGSPIGVGGAKGEFLGAWHFLGPPIDSCG